MKIKADILALAAIAISAGSINAKTTVKKSDFGKLPDGSTIFAYSLTNSHGIEAKIINYGGIIVSLKTPDRNGTMNDIVLGHDTLPEYLADGKTYFGALIGRYANRIGGAKFKLNGAEYKLPQNDGKNSLHGGIKGFDKRVWASRE